MIRFVGYRQDSTNRDLIFESARDTNWARAMSANNGNAADAPVFFLIDFTAGTATLTDTGTGRTDSVTIDTLPVRMDYLGVVIREMEAELDTLITEHGTIEPR